MAIIFVYLLLQIPDRESTKIPTREKLSQLDATGTAFLVPGLVCLLLALQWGGLTYPVCGAPMMSSVGNVRTTIDSSLLSGITGVSLLSSRSVGSFSLDSWQFRSSCQRPQQCLREYFYNEAFSVASTQLSV